MIPWGTTILLHRVYKFICHQSTKLFLRKIKYFIYEAVEIKEVNNRLVQMVFSVPPPLPIQKHLCFVPVWIPDIPCHFVHSGENIGFWPKNMYQAETKPKVTKSYLNLKTKNYSLSSHNNLLLLTLTLPPPFHLHVAS